MLPPNLLKEGQKIQISIQSLNNQSLQTTLVSYSEIKGLKTISEVNKKDIEIDDKVRLNDLINIDNKQDDMTSEIDNPMEVDIHYLQQRKNQRICGGNKRSGQCNSNKDKKNYSSNKHQSRYSKQKNNPPRLYDKNINPVRGYCGKAHRTIDCKQHNYKNRSRQTHRLSSNQSSKDEVKLDNPTSIEKV